MPLCLVIKQYLKNRTNSAQNSAYMIISEQVRLVPMIISSSAPEEDDKQCANYKAVEKTVLKSTMADPKNKPAAENRC